MTKLSMRRINDAAKADVTTIVVHPAPHHADDVMAVALFAMMHDQIKVVRTRTPEDIEQAARNGATICDVGNVYDPTINRFDHHQYNFAEAREDGTKYSSVGLLWKIYGVVVCRLLAKCELRQAQDIAARVDRMLIKGIDAIDNGQLAPSEAMSVSQAISLFNLNWDEPCDSFGEDFFNDDFEDACQLAYAILNRTVQSCISAAKGRDIVEESITASEKGVLRLSRFISGWIETVVNSANPKAEGILYGVFPNLQGQWNVQAMPPKSNPHAQRKPLPEAWRGLSNEALQKVTGVSDAVFCHTGGFICGAQSLEGAMRLARLAVADETL